VQGDVDQIYIISLLQVAIKAIDIQGNEKKAHLLMEIKAGRPFSTNKERRAVKSKEMGG
jgi:hypothetical protein